LKRGAAAIRLAENNPMPALIHRQATRADCALLGALNRQLIQDEGHRNPMTVPELVKRMRTWVGRREYTAELFEEGGEVVAYALYRELPDQIYLRHLFVARGRRRQGVGRQAMQLLFSECWTPGKRLTVEVLCANTGGVAFWKAMGYREYSLCLEIMPQPQQF
jgi:GNAT superfamily N-acetyltransferase